MDEELRSALKKYDFWFRETTAGREGEFYAIASCPELDELEQEKGNSDHREWSFLFHFVESRGTLICRFDQRIESIAFRKERVGCVGASLGGIIWIDKGSFSFGRVELFRSIFGLHWLNDLGFAIGSNEQRQATLGILREGQWHQWTCLSLPYDSLYGGLLVPVAADDVYLTFFGSGAGVSPDATIYHFNGTSIEPIPLPSQKKIDCMIRLGTNEIFIGIWDHIFIGNRLGWRKVLTTAARVFRAAVQDGLVYFLDYPARAIYTLSSSGEQPVRSHEIKMRISDVQPAAANLFFDVRRGGPEQNDGSPYLFSKGQIRKCDLDLSSSFFDVRAADL